MILKVSMDTFSEISDALEREGRKLGDAKIIQLEKTDTLAQPYNFKLVTIRRDVADIAAKAYKGHDSFIDLVKELYDFVLEGPKSEVETTETKWK